jgi:hypothetical protein
MLQENQQVFTECVLDSWETGTNQGQHDMDIAHRKFISTASGTLAIGVAAGSSTLQVSAAGKLTSNLTSDQPTENLCGSVDGLRNE